MFGPDAWDKKKLKMTPPLAVGEGYKGIGSVGEKNGKTDSLFGNSSS